MQNMESNPGTPLQQLQVDQRILLQDPISKKWECKGKITGIRSNGRSYNIILDSGKKFVRNRAFLRPIQNNTLQDKETNSEVIKPAPRRSPRLANQA